MTSTRRFHRAILPLALAANLLIGAAGCSDSEKAAATTTTAPVAGSTYFKPPLPSSLNPIPFLKGDLVALGNVKIRVAKVSDRESKKSGSGTRKVIMTTEVTNGSLQPLTLEAETFLAYVASGRSATPADVSMITKPMASGETRSIPLEFQVPRKSPVVFMVFNGQPYGDRVNSGLIAVDPKYKVPKAES